MSYSNEVAWANPIRDAGWLPPRYAFQVPARRLRLDRRQSDLLAAALSGLGAFGLLALLPDGARLLLVSAVMLLVGGAGLAWHGSAPLRRRASAMLRRRAVTPSR